MEINKQLFEDVLSGKLKGKFILRNGNKISSYNLLRNVNNQQAETYPYNLLRQVPYLTRRANIKECGSYIEESGVYDSYTDTGIRNICFGKSDFDIIDFEHKMNVETRKFLVYCKLDGIKTQKEVILEKGEKANINTFLEKVMPDKIFMEKEDEDGFPISHHREVFSWSVIEE